MAAAYRFLIEDIMSRKIIAGHIPFDDWTYEDSLNRPGSMRARLPLTSPFAKEELLEGYARAVYVERNGRIDWGGILLPPRLALGSSVLDIEVFGWLGYWDMWGEIDVDYQPVTVDQFNIFRTLILNAQNETIHGTGFDLGIDAIWTALSGVTRDRTDDYRPWKTKNLGEALRQLAAVDNGFDYAMEYTKNVASNRVDRNIRLYYPRKGRDTGFRFRFDLTRGRKTNVIARGFGSSPQLAWRGAGWGDGADSLRISTPYIDTTLRNVYPPYGVSPGFSGVTIQTTLDQHTAAWFGQVNRPRRIPLLQIDPDRSPVWGDWEIGDTVLISIDDGYGSTSSVPEAWRIVGYQVDSADRYTITLDAA